MSRFWTRSEVNELHEIVEHLQRYTGALSRLASKPGRHGLVAGLTLAAGHNVRDARLSLEDALRISEEDSNEIH
jgi:hypothetical protein